MTNDSTTNDPSAAVLWKCFSCGKHLGAQGAGGSFNLDFGYGSGFDRTRGINGWICDECVVQKHDRLRVSSGASGGDYWLNQNQVPLEEHKHTKGLSLLDFFGRGEAPWGRDAPQGPLMIRGFRDYEWITADERNHIENALFAEEPVDSNLVVKLLQALMESEASRHEAHSQRWRAENRATSRARQQAQRLSDEELATLRRQETEDRLDVARLWEHVEWHNTHYDEQARIIEELEAKIVKLTTPE